MRSILPIILLLFLSYALSAQVETVVSDGYYGVYFSFDNDTLKVDRVFKDGPAALAGIQTGDKVLFINDYKVSGLRSNYEEVEPYLEAKAGTKMDLKILRKGVDSIINCNIILGFSREINTSFCYYDYLVDGIDQLTPRQIFSDSVGDLLSSVIDNSIKVFSLVQDTITGFLNIMPGDIFLNFDYDGFDSWAKFMFSWYQDVDTIIRISRDSTEFELHADLREYPKLKITSFFEHDLQKESILIRIIITNCLVEDKTILLRFEPYDTIKLYKRGDEESIIEQINGTAIQDLSRNSFFKTSPVFRLNLQKDTRDTLFIAIKQRGGILYPPQVDILSYDYVVRFEYTERLVLGAILGILIIIVFYYLILLFFLKAPSYLIYLLFIISLCFTLFYFSGYGSQFIWTRSINFFSNIDVLFYSIPFTLFLVFNSIYLGLRHNLKNWHRIGRVIIILLWVFSLLILIDAFTNKTVLWSPLEGLFYNLFSICLCISTVFIFSTIILRIRQNYKPAWYLLIGMCVLLLSAVIYLLRYPLTGLISASFNISVDFTAIILNASFFLGAIIQFLIFAFGIVKKMRDSDMEVKLAQENLITQLKENEKLKDKVNLELEQKVLERTKEIELQKNDIQQKQEEITASINYAKRIQTAALPSNELLEEILPEHFVLFQPRDIVSGDFYWIRQVKNFTVVVAADCTGHGVPGAFMSMLGMSLLNEQVSSRRFDNTGEILNRMRKKVKETLRQEGKSLEQKDGMDLALAIIDNESLELQFSGAFNPLYIVRKKTKNLKRLVSDYHTVESDNSLLIEIKGDRQPIAIHSFEKDFTTNIIQLQPGDTLYLFSDGYPDQFGGPDNKKFMTSKFKKLLLQIQKYDLIKQNEILKKTLTDWQGNNQQIDDIIVFGIRWH